MSWKRKIRFTSSSPGADPSDMIGKCWLLLFLVNLKQVCFHFTITSVSILVSKWSTSAFTFISVEMNLVYSKNNFIESFVGYRAHSSSYKNLSLFFVKFLFTLTVIYNLILKVKFLWIVFCFSQVSCKYKNVTASFIN